MNWFTKLFSSKSEPVTQRYASVEAFIASTPVPSVDGFIAPAPLPLLNQVFLDAIQEAHEEVFKQEQELLQNDKLQKALRKAVKYMASELNKDNYSFILVHAHQIGISDNVFETFCKIAQGVFKQYGIGIVFDSGHTYFRVEKEDIRKAFKKLRTSAVDVDERIRAMLSTGIYR